MRLSKSLVAVTLAFLARGTVPALANYCPGDLDSSGSVEVHEIVRIVAAALGDCPGECPGDLDSSGNVTVDEIVVAIDKALQGCLAAACPHTFGTIFDSMATDPFCAFEGLWPSCPYALKIGCTLNHIFLPENRRGGIACSLTGVDEASYLFVPIGSRASALRVEVFLLFTGDSASDLERLPATGTIELSPDHTVLRLHLDPPGFSYTHPNAPEPCVLTDFEAGFTRLTEPQD